MKVLGWIPSMVLAIPALGRWRFEGQKFRVIIRYITNPNPAWAMLRPYLKNKNSKRNSSPPYLVVPGTKLGGFQIKCPSCLMSKEMSFADFSLFAFPENLWSQPGGQREPQGCIHQLPPLLAEVTMATLTQVASESVQL